MNEDRPACSTLLVDPLCEIFEEIDVRHIEVEEPLLAILDGLAVVLGKTEEVQDRIDEAGCLGCRARPDPQSLLELRVRLHGRSS